MKWMKKEGKKDATQYNMHRPTSPTCYLEPGEGICPTFCKTISPIYTSDDQGTSETYKNAVGPSFILKYDSIIREAYGQFLTN
jgi:hypothetical protein